MKLDTIILPHTNWACRCIPHGAGAYHQHNGGNESLKNKLSIRFPNNQKGEQCEKNYGKRIDY